MAKKTIKYLENGEYHDATVKDVGVIEELKTESKDNLVEAINEIFLGGGKGFSDLQQKVDESTQAAQNAQQAANNLQQRLEEVANAGLSDEEAQKIINQAVEDAKRAQAEALQAYKDAQKELDDSMAQFMEEQKAINKELEQAKADIQGDIDQKNTEIEQINAVIESTKSDLTATSARLASVRNDLTNAQMDWGKVRTEITNINGKLDSKMSNTDFDEYKERIERNETEITQTKNELQSKATKQDLDVLTGTVTTQGSGITQLAGKIEQKVSKDTLANDIDNFQVKKANIFTGTREFMGWEFSDKALGRVNDDIYNHAKVAELHNGSNLSITVDGLEVGKTYSVSIFAKASANSNTSGVKVTVDNGKSYSGLMRTVYTPHDTKVTTNWQRYYATIVASATTMKFVFDRSGMTSDITLYLNRPKLEVGETVYAWEDNAQDIYKRVEHTEAQFDVYNDQISGIVKRQTETDKKIENVSSTFSQRADGIEANSKKYTNDKVTGLTEEFSGKLRATSQELSTEYEKQTNAKIGALSDGGSNLILNSSFLVTDDNGNATLENWRDTSSKVSLTKPNGLDGTWIKVNRATTGTALGARSNYFPVKQGKLVVGVDVALDGTGNISPYILRIEYYDVSNNRVNYEDITLQKLGLSASQITKSGSNFRYARGVYKTSNDRSDVAKACIVVPETITGYDMYLTNFFAKFSDVNDGTYEVNPLDQQASLIKQRTKIEQDSEKINLLNTQTEKLGNDIKATNTSVNVLKGEVDLKASQSTVNDLTNRVAKNAADIKVFPDKIKSEVSEVSKKIDGVNDKVDNIKVGGTNLIPHSEVDTIRGDTDYWVFSTGNINNYGGRYNPTDKSLELEAHIKDTNYQFLQWQQQNNVLMNTELAHLQVGDVLTVSAEVYIQNPNMSGNITLGFRVNPKTNYDSYFSTERGIDLRNLKTGWQRVSATGTITQKYLDCMNDVQLMRILLAANGLKENNKIAFRKIKAEKGNIATDWSPATEDTDASIESVKTVATQTKDGFDRLTQKTGYNASTGEFSKVTTQINEGIKGVSTQVSSVSNRLDNLSVGGVNLMRNTARDYVKFTGGGWGVDYLTPNHQAVDTPVEGGGTYTFSAWVKNDKSSAGRIDIEIYQYNANSYTKQNGSSSEISAWVSPGEEKRLVFTKTLLSDTTRVRLHARNRDNNGTVTYWTKMAQVEKGNIATDWSPAPEDLQAGIDTATTKATQTNTKFERMISQIQYNDSTGEIGKYEHKVTELANGTQEKISALTKRGNNMVIKSSFDDGTDLGGWYNASGAGYSNEFYRTTTTAPKPDEMSSNYCVALGGRDALEANNIFPVVSGTKYYISAWVYTSRKYSGKVGLYVRNSNNNNRNWLGATVPKDDQNRWIKVKNTVTIPNGYNIAQPWLQVEKTTNDNEKIYFTDISITRADDNAIELSETMTTRIGDLERTVRTNTTDIGQYRQEMTNSAKELSLKLTSYQNLVLNDISGVKNNLNNMGQTNLYYNSEFTYTGTDPHNMDGIQSTRNVAYSKNDRWSSYKGSNAVFASTRGTLNDYYYIEHRKDKYVKVQPGEVVSASVVAWVTGGSDVPRDGYALCTISFYKDLSSSRMGYKETSVAAKDINYPYYRTLKVENVTVPDGANYMILHLIIRGSSNWQFSQPMLVKDSQVGAYVPSTQLQLNQVADKTNSNTDKIGILQGQITANANKFNTVYTKTDVDNKINPLNSRTEFLQDNSKFLLRVQQAGAATGGVNNLLTNSDTFDGYSENNTNSFDFQKIEGSGLPSVPNQPSITMMGHVWNDYGSVYNKNDGIYLENGETYWFGVYLMTDSNAGAFRNLSVYATTDKNQMGGNTDKTFFSEGINFNKHFGGKTKAWQWNTFKLTGDGTTRYNWRIELFNHIGGSIWTAGYMLVKSPLPPTGWSPNMTDVQMRLDSGGVTINGNTRINGVLNAKGMVLDDKTGSKLEFNSSGLDISYSQNREQYFTFGGNGLDFWRMSRDEAMDDYPDHHKPGYVHLGSMLALDNEYTKSVNRPDQQHTNTPSNNNGIGFVIDVTGGADNFAILQKGAEYRKGEKWGRINFNETVNNSHFPIWEINATGYGSHAWLQSGYNRGRGIFNYSNLYFYTDPVIGTEHDPDGKDYFPIERIGLVGNDGWGGLAVWADNKNVVSIRTNDEYPVVANGLIISKHTGDNDGVYIGGDGRQWVNLINTRNVRADVSSKDGRHYSNHLGSMFLYELRYGALTHTSQLSRKTDVSPIDINDLSSKLLSIDLFKYKYKSQKENEKYRYGGIIDDVNEVKKYNLPQEFISTNGEGIDDSNLITGLIATAKIQAKEIEKLNFRILELERGKING